LLCGCANLERGTQASWVEVERVSMSDKCVRLHLQVEPPQAVMRLDRNAACMARCCWVYGDKPTVITLDFNSSVAREFGETGNTAVFTPGKVNITIGTLLGTGYLRVKAIPDVISRDGTLKLSYEGMFGNSR